MTLSNSSYVPDIYAKSMKGYVSLFDGVVLPYQLYVFPQYWANTCIGIPGMGGQALTCSHVFVFSYEDKGVEYCSVFSDGEFLYTVRKTEAFIRDLRDMHVRACCFARATYDVVKCAEGA